MYMVYNIIILISQVSFVQQRCSSSAFHLEGLLGGYKICYESEDIPDHRPARDNWLIAVDCHCFLHNVV